MVVAGRAPHGGQRQRPLSTCIYSNNIRGLYYSWIAPPVDAHEKLIPEQTKRPTTNVRIRGSEDRVLNICFKYFMKTSSEQTK